jgi:hypothetical protein
MTSIAHAQLPTDKYGNKLIGENIFRIRLCEFGITITIIYDTKDYSIRSATYGASWTDKGEKFAHGVIYCIPTASCSSNVKKWMVTRNTVIRERTWEYRALGILTWRGTLHLTIIRSGKYNYIDGGYSVNEQSFDWETFVKILQGLIDIISKI